MVRITLGVSNLPKLDTIGWCDPYIKVFQNGELFHTTQVLRKTTHAFWDDFPIHLYCDEDEYRFEVWDDDTWSKDDKIGEITLELGKIRENQNKGVDEYALGKGGNIIIQMGHINMNLQVVLQDLQDMDKGFFRSLIGGAKTDPYFKAYVNAELVYTSEFYENAECTKFKPFPVSCDSIEDELTIEIYDKDKFTADDRMGMANFLFEEIIEYGITKQPVKDNEGGLLANVTLKHVDHLEESHVDMSEKPECKHRDQPFLYELQTRVQNGGFHGKVFILQKLGEAGTWLNNVLFAGKQELKIFVAESCIYLVDHIAGDNKIVWVQLFDRSLKVKLDGVNVWVKNLDRDMRCKCGSDVDAEELYRQIMENLEENEYVQQLTNEPTPHESYALERPDSRARWFCQGRDYFWYLSHVIEAAQKEIFITDWWFSPEVELRRPAEKYGRGWSLIDLLIRKAEQDDVLVYIQLFGSTGEKTALQLGPERVESIFNGMRNIQVMKHGADATKLFLWSHHEKLCVVDQCVAFVGGIDLCANRWDDERYLLLDEKSEALHENYGFGEEPPADIGEPLNDGMVHGEEGQLFPGKDYLNSFVMDKASMDDWRTDLLDRCKYPRMPWQDIASVVYGKAAWDVARHFIQRWNFTKMQQAKSSTADLYTQIRYLLPLPMSQVEDSITDDMKNVPCEEGRDFSHEEPLPVTAQVLRSFGEWSGGMRSTEHSIQSAYLDLIDQAERFIYIENQFFVTTLDAQGHLFSQNRDVQNRLGQKIVDRIVRAHENGEQFKIYIVIPLMPEFNGDIYKAETEAETLKTIMHFQYAGICKDDPACDEKNCTIFSALQSKGIDPAEYIHFSALRSWQLATTNRAVTELIYVHSKLMIVDDKYTVIGSANFNDRSQEGDRDSEFCIKITDVDGSNFAESLRLKLWNRFVGGDCSGQDPETTEFFQSWKEISRENARKFEDVFRRAPNNSITNYTELNAYKDEKKPLAIDGDGSEAVEILKSIQGVLIEFPLQFLKDEWYHPSTFGYLTKENMTFSLGTFT